MGRGSRRTCTTFRSPAINGRWTGGSIPAPVSSGIPAGCFPTTSRLVVYGVSYGGQAAQLLGIHYPKLVHGVVALVTENGSWCGIPAYHFQQVSCLGAAWSYDGKPVPYNPSPNPYFNPAPFHDEDINGPIFLACGEADRFGSCPSERWIVARLRAHHFAHHVTFLDYPNVGHGIGELTPYVPFADSRLDGLDSDANWAARADGWPKLLHFLAGLRSPPG